MSGQNEGITSAHLEKRAVDTSSKQPRFDSRAEAVSAVVNMLNNKWSIQEIADIPDYTPSSRELDSWLNSFYRQETLLSGVVSNVVAIDKNRGWELTGGRNQVARFTRVFRAVDNGIGWRNFASRQSESFWTTNIGAITEVARLGEGGPMAALYHVDPTRCQLTGNVDTPLEYYSGGLQSKQLWYPQDYFQTVSMPNIKDEFNGLGFCAVMRAIQYTILMVAVYRHDKEVLLAALPKGLLLMSGIDEVDWEDAMEANMQDLTAKERELFSGLSIFFSNDPGGLDAKLVSLSQLPHNFNMESWTNMLMYGYALCFGYDPREFWPVSGGTLGTGRETEVQALKASGKGGLDWALTYQDNIQRQLPPTVLFEFQQRDEAGEAAEYEAQRAFAELVNTMAMPIESGGVATLSREERRTLFAERGLIPEEWTITEEDVTATDTETPEQRSALNNPQIIRACEMFPDEPIVKMSWDWKRGLRWRTVFDYGGKAIERKRGYSFPTQQRQEDDVILYENDELGFTITEADIMRANQKWDARHEPEWEGLPEAESVDEDETE